MEIQHRRRELAIMEIHRRELVAILLFAVLLLSVSSSYVKVTAQDNGSSAEKVTITMGDQE
jgi:hypothetical protein